MVKNKNLFTRLKALPFKIETLYDRLLWRQRTNDIKESKVLMGKMMSYLNTQKTSINNLSEVEFQVFSQWGDDGIIQFLINKLEIPHHTFIEFGVENYKESNTRFLVINDNWTGLVIDGSDDNINYIKSDSLSWAYELHAISSFITAENINQLISQFLKHGYDKEIGILSIDIDGNDYWVWKAIEVIDPVIVIVEYNSLLGADKSLTIPYDPNFIRNTKYNLMYWGVSIPALCNLANEKGYAFIGCNSAGNNAYFVRREKLNNVIKESSIKDGFVLSKFREILIEKNMYRPIGNERMQYLKGLSFLNIKTNTIEQF